MSRKTEAVTLASNGLTKTFDHLSGQSKAFSAFDYAEKQADLQSKLLAVMKQGKVIRTFPCFSCGRCFSPKKMSSCLIICKLCFAAITAQSKGKTARNNFIEKALNNFHKFLRRRISV
jgi:hypothetical protein